MAYECDWDKDFIADNFTLAQITRYYELIYIEKIKDLKLTAIAMRQSMTKKEDFLKFLKSLDAVIEPADNEEAFKKMKSEFPGMVEDK